MRRDERLLELALERWSQRQIAAEVGLTQGGVSKALRRIFTRQLATLTEETEASRVKLVLLAERRAGARPPALDPAAASVRLVGHLSSDLIERAHAELTRPPDPRPAESDPA